MRISALPWALALTACLAIPAGADTIRFGNDAAATVYSCPFDVGVQHGIFQARGLTIEAATFAGAAKAQPALIGGNLDILLGAGSEMAFIVKGAPELTVAVVAGSPNSMALIVGAQSSIQTLGALRGHKLGFTNTGGLTDWLARQVIEREHIPPGAITLVAAGTTPTEVAMLRIGQLDAAILDTVLAHNLEAGGQARILQMFGPYVPDFASMVLFAHRDLIAAHPETIRAFLAAWFEAQALFLSDTNVAVDCVVGKTKAPVEIARRVMEEVHNDFTTDGRFRPSSMQVLAKSLVETGVLSEQPDMSKLYSEAFLPKR